MLRDLRRLLWQALLEALEVSAALLLESKLKDLSGCYEIVAEWRGSPCLRDLRRVSAALFVESHDAEKHNRA